MVSPGRNRRGAENAETAQSGVSAVLRDLCASAVNVLATMTRAEADDRRFWPFTILFAAYLAIRGAVYEPLLVASAVGLLTPFRAWAAAFAVVVEALFIREHLYLVSNHGLLEVAILALYAVLPARGLGAAGRAALLRSVQAILVVMLVWAGLQKVVYGYYASGEYFVVEAAQPGKIAERLGPLVAEENDRKALSEYHARLRDFAREGGADGALFEPPLPRPRPIPLLSKLFCWATLAAELLLPVLLVPRRTRGLAVAALALFMIGVQAIADEWHYFLLFVALLVPFAPDGWLPARLRRGEATAPLGRARAAAAAGLVALVALWPIAHVVLVRKFDLNPWKLGGFAMYAVPGRWEITRIETRRTPGAGPWERWTRRPGVPLVRLQSLEDRLKNAPLADAPAHEIAAIVRADRRTAAEVKVRVRTVIHDRHVDRFRLREWVYEIR